MTEPRDLAQRRKDAFLSYMRAFNRQIGPLLAQLRERSK